MKTHRSLLIFLLLLALSWLNEEAVCAQDFPPIAADAPPAPELISSTSRDFSNFTCTSTDVSINAAVFDLARDTRSRLYQLLQVSSTTARFSIDLRIVTPDDPLAARVNVPLISAPTDGKTLTLSAIIPTSVSNLREVVQRQFVTELLWERFFANRTSFDADTPLDVVPFWLREGLRESLVDDPQHSREEVVRRAALSQRAPSLREVTQWQKLDENDLVGFWQRSFCYYLVNSLIESEDRRNNFRAWLNALVSDRSALPPNALFPTESAWQREMADASNRSHALFFTWEETLSALAAAQPVQIKERKTPTNTTTPASTPKPPPLRANVFTQSASVADYNFRLVTLDEIATLPRTPLLMQAVMPKLVELTELELRANPSWHDVLELYRQGLTAMLNEKTYADADRYIQRAKQIRAQEINYHKALVDYLNCFEVNKDYRGASSSFTSYFNTVQRLEQPQTNEPNPLQTDLLRVEKAL